jgi:hypothetical protein
MEEIALINTINYNNNLQYFFLHFGHFFHLVIDFFNLILVYVFIRI